MVFLCKNVYIWHMQSFLSKVVFEVLQLGAPPEEITFVLPNKRSGLFLKNQLKTALSGNAFVPRIISIEDFVKEVIDTRHLISVYRYYWG